MRYIFLKKKILKENKRFQKKIKKNEFIKKYL